MMKHRTVTFVVVALLSVSLLASRVVAAEETGVMMKEDEMTTTNGHKVMPDGTMKMPGGKEMRMQEGQMMTMDGKMMKGGKAMHGGKDMMGDKGMKMEGMDK